MRGEFHFVRADGESRIVEYAVTANFLPHRHLCVMRDLTEWKKSEKQVQELTRQLEQTQANQRATDLKPALSAPPTEDCSLEQIARHIPGVICQFRMRPDGTYHFPYASKGLREIYGLAREEVQEDASKIFSIIHSEDRDRVTQSILASAEHLTPWYCEYRVNFPDGRLLWLLTHATPQREPDGSTLWHGYIQDISDRKQVEEHLRNSLKNLSELKLALEQAAIVAITDERGIINYASEKFCEISKYSREELIGQNHRLINSGYHPQEFFQNLWQTISAGQIWQGEIKNKAKDGTFYWVDTTILPLLNENGKPHQYLSIRFEITAKKETEAQLKEVSERLAFSLQSGGIGCWEWDIVENTLVWDERMYELYGVTKKDNSRLAYEIWSTGLHPDDKDFSEALIRQALLGEAEFDPEFRVVHPDGSIHHIKAFGLVRRDAEGNPQKMIGVNFEISDRKEAEILLQQSQKRYQTLAEASPIGVFLTDPNGDCLYVNQTWSQITGLTQQQALGQHWSRTVHPEDRERVFQEWNNSTLNQQQIKSEYRFLRADGSVAWVIGQALPLIDSEGKIEGYVGTVTDITDHKRQEQALRQSEIQRQQTEELKITLKKLQETQTQLIQAEKMSSLGQLVAGIAHEINNPVSFIYGNLKPTTDYVNNLINLIHLYQEHYPNPPQTISDLAEEIDLEYLVKDFYQLIKSMKTGATRICEIVKSLRTFSRLDESDLKAIDLHENIESTLVIIQNRLNGRAGNPEIHLRKNYGKLPLIECYGGLLNQVFMNLLLNTIDAIEQKRETLEPSERLRYRSEITITTSILHENRVYISIEDNGCGMSPEVQAKIFNPFFTTKPVGQGTGMGLATSYQIITDNHQGSLQCFSTLGKGTEFVITFPLRSASYQPINSRRLTPSSARIDRST
jgi:PAS domain S-box-containing protein